MKYDVLTFDTQAITTNNFDFDGGWLAQVKQFKDGPIDVVVSSVVAREIRKQLADKIRQTKDKLESAVKDSLHYGMAIQPTEQLKLPEASPRELATKRVKAYVDAIGGTIVPVSLITVDELMKQYFKPAPPFTGTGKKKAEFPDAVALMTLEAWAKANGKKLLAVSGDGDWPNFSEKSPYIDTVPTWEVALERLQENAAEAEALVEKFLAEIDKDGTDAAKTFESLLEPEVEGYSVHPTIETDRQAEVDGGELSLISCSLAGEMPEFDFKIVRFGPSVVAASVELSLTVKATAYVSFYQWDSIDKESFPMGDVVSQREVDDLRATVIATWDRDILEGDWALTSVEMVSVDDPDMGYVEPDWGDAWEE